MCFSAEASFISGSVLVVAGIASVKNAKTISQSLFFGIPLIFAFQQFTEGFLWLALKGRIDPGWETVLTYCFICIAQVIWPVWVPLSISLLEKKPERKKLFFVLTGIGAGISVTIICRLVFYPVSAAIENHHIIYHMQFPVLVKYLGAASYFIATVIPTFASSVKRMRLLGVLILISYLVAAIFFTRYAISVWCFFSAAISIVIYLISKEINKDPVLASLSKTEFSGRK